MDARAPVGPAAPAVDRLDFAEDHFVFSATGTRRTPFPCVVPDATDPVETTDPADAVPLPVLLDEREFRALSSEQNRMAFFSSSCSSLSRACSRSNRRSRCSSLTICASGRIASPRPIPPSRYCLRHRESMFGWISRDSETPFTPTPSTWLSWTARALKLSSYFTTRFGPFVAPIRHLLLGPGVYIIGGTSPSATTPC